MPKHLFIGPEPDNRTLVVSCLTGATFHDAREYSVRWYNAAVYKAGKGTPIAAQDFVSSETGEDAIEDVRLQQVGSAAASPNTLRLQVQRRTGKCSFTAWEDV